MQRSANLSAISRAHHDRHRDRPRRTRARAADAGSSTPVVPQSVKGPSAGSEWASTVVTLTIYYLAPFLRWERGIGEPNQAILLDFEHSRLYAFFIEIWPQELCYVTGLLILAATILILANALADPGCGAASPARRRSGPTCSCWWSGGSKATAAIA